MNVCVIAPELVNQGDNIPFIINVKNVKGENISGLSITLRIFRNDINFERVVSIPEESPGVYSISLTSENLEIGTYNFEIFIESDYYYDKKIEGSFNITGEVLISAFPEKIFVKQGEKTWFMVLVHDAAGNKINANLTALLNGVMISINNIENGFNVSFNALLGIGKHTLILRADTEFGVVSKGIEVVVSSVPNITINSKQTFIQNETIELEIMLKDSMGYTIDNASITASFADRTFNLLCVGDGVYRAEISPVGLKGGTYVVTISVTHEFLESKILSMNLIVIFNHSAKR